MVEHPRNGRMAEMRMGLQKFEKSWCMRDWPCQSISRNSRWRRLVWPFSVEDKPHIIWNVNHHRLTTSGTFFHHNRKLRLIELIDHPRTNGNLGREVTGLVITMQPRHEGFNRLAWYDVHTRGQCYHNSLDSIFIIYRFTRNRR